MFKHIKNKLTHNISRLISSPEITPITTRSPTEGAPLIIKVILCKELLICRVGRTDKMSNRQKVEQTKCRTDKIWTEKKIL